MKPGAIMTSSNTLDILKKAIVLEQRGHAFYTKVAQETRNEGVKTFFQTMAKEETLHLKVLADQFKAYNKEGKFEAGSFSEARSSDLPARILNQDTMKQISAAGFEAAAIGAAIAMEQRAVDMYAAQAEQAVDPEEKRLYNWLSNWEKDHLSTLVDIDRALLEEAWADNNFWPF